MNIQLSEHFTYKKLLRFILPSIIMMVFTSIYSVVDGIFVSNFVGKSAFASVNLIMPYLMGISALGFMIGTGGSAFVSTGKSVFFDAGYDCCYRRICVICSQFYIYEADCHGIWCRR